MRKLTVAKLRKGGTFELYCPNRKAYRRRRVGKSGMVFDPMNNEECRHQKHNVYKTNVRNLRQPRMQRKQKRKGRK